VPKTLLAVDDSATMRKVLEITFAGEDFRVVTAGDAASALAKMSEEPMAVVIDTSWPDGADGYGLAKEVRARDPRVAIVLMASRYAPFDANRGREAGVDDFIDKPFDTQALIDKMKKAIMAREAGKAAPPPAPVIAPVAAPPAPAAAPPPPHIAPLPPFVSPRPPVVAAVAPRPATTTQRTHTLSFEGSGNAPPVAAPPPHPVAPLTRTAPSGLPAFNPPPAPPVVHPTSPSMPRSVEAPPVAAAVNGQLAGKLGELGLTAAQADAVMALSREVVERVVWEVVPQLAEAIIKEEIARLTKDG
jgi:CheY-like chemotaxis protein